MIERVSWHPLQRRLIPAALRPWLAEPGSLTRKLRDHNQVDFSVLLLGNSWIRPLADEAVKLGSRVSCLAYQREVLLMDGELPNVYARTIVPRATYQAMPFRFNQLGNQPLGEMLFSDPHVKRGEIEIAQFHPGDWLYDLALFDLPLRVDVLWGRRSVFYLNGWPLLVNELFLPTLLRD